MNSFKSSSSEKYNLFSIKKTQIEMMRDRGYDVGEDEQKILSMEEDQFDEYLTALVEGEIVNNWKDYLDMIRFPAESKYTSRTWLGNVYFKENKRCIVIYIDQSSGEQVLKVITDAIIVMIEGIDTGIKYDELIMISGIPFSSSSKKSIRDLKYTKHWSFMDRELIYNVTKHFLVPPHTLMPESEVRKMGKSVRNLHQISELDPVVKYYGWSAGGVVLIKRDISEVNMSVRFMIAKRLIVKDTAVNDVKK